MWAAAGRLTGKARRAVEEEALDVFVSPVSVWEIEIKRALDRIRAPDDVAALVDASGFERLTINFDHAREAGRLLLHHGDPFDRMLVAQARIEGLTLATADVALARYDVPVLDLRDATG